MGVEGYTPTPDEDMSQQNNAVSAPVTFIRWAFHSPPFAVLAKQRACRHCSRSSGLR